MRQREAAKDAPRAIRCDPVKWGIDMQIEHERWLTETYIGRPVAVKNYPKDIKAFYMRQNDDGKTVAAMDILTPGIGDIVSGSQREERLDARMDEIGLHKADYWWYRDLRRYGTAPHAGFRLGFERAIIYATGMANIRDVIPFPRAPKTASSSVSQRSPERSRPMARERSALGNRHPTSLGVALRGRCDNLGLLGFGLSERHLTRDELRHRLHIDAPGHDHLLLSKPNDLTAGRKPRADRISVLVRLLQNRDGLAGFRGHLHQVRVVRVVARGEYRESRKRNQPT
jgi:hypothetical protein